MPRAASILALASALAVAAAVALTTDGATAATTPTIKVTFAGTAAARLLDTERWVLLSSNECYLRRTRDQATALTWAVSFRGAGRALAATAPTVSGAVSGTEVRDSCDDVAEELPPEAPADWIAQLRCSDSLHVLQPARASWSSGTLRLLGPVTAVATTAVCTALPRSDELNVRIPLTTARVAAMQPGAKLRFAVGSATPKLGTYRRRANCLHPAKPYDGYRSFDTCVDTMRWSGVVTVTRI